MVEIIESLVIIALFYQMPILYQVFYLVVILLTTPGETKPLFPLDRVKNLRLRETGWVLWKADAVIGVQMV